MNGRIKKIWGEWKKKIGMPRMLLLFLCGLLLLILSWPRKEEEGPDLSSSEAARTEVMSDEAYAAQLEKKALRIVESMEGVEKAEVAITLKDSGEKVVQKNIRNSAAAATEIDQEGGSRISSEQYLQEEAVLAEGQPYVIQENKPEIAGIAVCVKGTGTPLEISEISEAMQALFDVPAHRIKVLKMD